MRTVLATLFLSFLLISCNDEYPANCKGYSAGIYKHGYAYAKGSYEDFGDHAIFVRDRIADTVNGGWTHDPVEKGIMLSTINESCAEKIHMDFHNIELNLGDTINLKYSWLGTSKDFPTAVLHYVDIDAVIEEYDMIEHENNWLIIDEINRDTTEIRGRFKASFVTVHERFLSGERERSDDPNRPDTLHFSSGEFRAEFAPF